MSAPKIAQRLWCSVFGHKFSLRLLGSSPYVASCYVNVCDRCGARGGGA